LKEKIDALFQELDEHIKNNNVKAINIPAFKEPLQEEIRDIMNQITSGSEEEKKLKQITDEFETILKQKIIDFTFKYLETKIAFDIENFTSKLEFDEYEKTSDFSHWRISGILDENNPNNASVLYENMKKEILIKNMGKSEFIKKKADLIYFGNVAFPVYQRQTKKQQWKLDPKIDGNNVIVQYKEISSGMKIKPSDEKRLRFDERKYEFTRDEYKKLLQEYENFKKLSNAEDNAENIILKKDALVQQLQNLRKQKDISIDKEDEDKEIVALKKEIKQLRNKINQMIPHFFNVLQRLNAMTHKAYGDIPDLSSKIKITPYILENLQSFIELAKDQIIRQDGI